MSTTSNHAREKLAAHMKAVIAETEDLLKATAGQAGDKIQSVRSSLEKTIKTANDRIMEFEHEAVEKVKEGAKVTDKYVHENPWQSIGIAAGIGVILGWILCKK